MKKWIIISTIAVASCDQKMSDLEKSNLQKELTKMVKVDQQSANIPQGEFLKYSPEEWQDFKDSVFKTHTLRLKEIYKKYGFLGYDKVGEDGSFNFWLMIQHADDSPYFQKKVLEAMKKEVTKGNASFENYAYLFDRVQVNSKQKQMFGTQVEYDLTGKAKPQYGLIDSLNVDKLRERYHLGPLKEYFNQMTKMHFEMNKNHYESKGIMKPNLY